MRVPQSPPKRRIPLADILVQVLFVVLVLGAAVFFVTNALGSVNDMGMTTGFGFLERARGWQLSFSVLDTTAQDTYLRTFMLGAVNTLFVGFLAIVFSTVLGFMLGVMQVGQNVFLRWGARTFVETFRNIPTIVYLIFIYAVMLNVPRPSAAYSFFDIAFLSNRGLVLPGLSVSVVQGLLLLLGVAGIVAITFSSRARSWLRLDGIRGGPVGAVAVLLVAMILLVLLAGNATVSIPSLQGFNFSGGMVLPLEVVTLVLALTIFGTCYIGEIVRGGLQSVPKGLIEAAESLGLKPGPVFWTVRLPVAMRIILPAISNQYLYMMKGTSLGLVIGFSDLFGITTQSINYSGQTLEILAIMMLIFIIINFTISRMMSALNQHLQYKTND